MAPEIIRGEGYSGTIGLTWIFARHLLHVSKPTKSHGSDLFCALYATGPQLEWTVLDLV